MNRPAQSLAARMRRCLLLLVCAVAAATGAQAQTLSGRVVAATGEPLAYAQVFVEGSTLGVMTDLNGNYSLALTAGTHRVVAQMLGYRRVMKTVALTRDQRLDFVLAEEDVELETTIITSNGRDPAYWIIQQAIQHRDQNRLQFQEYQVTSYQKTVLRHQSIMAQDINDRDALRLLAAADSMGKAGKGPATKSAGVAGLPAFLGEGSSPEALLGLLPLLLSGAHDSLASNMGLLGPLARSITVPDKDGTEQSLNYWYGQLQRSGLMDSVRSAMGSLLQDSSAQNLLGPLLPLARQALGGNAAQAPNVSIPLPPPAPHSPPKLRTAQVDSSKGIAYLEENIVRKSFGRGGKSKVEMLSTRVSGQSEAVGLLGTLTASVFNFDPYENMTNFEGIIPQGAVSPISGSAMLYYDYKLLGTVKEDGIKRYKIRVIPKNPYGPSFSGLIYIVDSSFAVSAVDLCLTKANNIFLCDTVRVEKEYVHLDEGNAWVPHGLRVYLTARLAFGGIAAIDVQGECIGLESDYVVDPVLPRGFWNNEILSVGDSATRRDSSYWSGARAMGLRTDEAQNYQEMDSLANRHNDPAWQDSMTRASAHFVPLQFLSRGYHFKNYRTQNRLDIAAPLRGVGFNPIEGFALQLSGKWTHPGKQKHALELSGLARYGFANHKFSYEGGIAKALPFQTVSRIFLKGGDMPQEFSQFAQTNALVEPTYNLLLKRNYYKMYQRQYVTLGVDGEVANGLVADVALNWESRFAWRNHSEYSVLQKDVAYSPNLLLPSHQALVLKLGLQYQPFMKYASLPTGRVQLGSKWPVFSAEYQRGMRDVLGSDIGYDKVRGGVRYALSLGTLGDLVLDAQGGTFLSQDSVALPDYFHFQSNQTIVRSTGTTDFQLMNYYAYSQVGGFVAAHANHAFNGFLMRKLPLIRRLGLEEFANAHYLRGATGDWLEVGVGLQKRIIKKLVPLRVDFSYRLLGDYGSDWRVLVTLFSLNGLGLDLGE